MSIVSRAMNFFNHSKMSKEQTQISTLKELADLIGSYTKWGTILVGGFCLVFYSNEIGQFPEGLNLGEGLAFYLVCAGFMLTYAVYFLSVTAMGSLLMAWPARKMQRFHGIRRQKRGRTKPDLKLLTDFSPMHDLSIAPLGFLGLLLTALYAFHDLEGAAFVLTLSICQGIFVALWLVAKRRQSDFEASLLVDERNTHSIDTSKSDAKKMQIFFMVALLVFPLWLGPNRVDIVNMAFKVAQLRKENATIQVKKPWATRIKDSTLTSAPSFLGDDYMEFRGVKVLLRSVGQKVVIELPQSSNKPLVKLSIPSDSIFVE